MVIKLYLVDPKIIENIQLKIIKVNYFYPKLSLDFYLKLSLDSYLKLSLNLSLLSIEEVDYTSTLLKLIL